MKRTKIMLLCLLNYAAASFSGTMMDIERESASLNWMKVITVSAGPAWSAPGHTQYINEWTNPTTAALVKNVLVNHRKTTLVGTGELFFSIQTPFSPGLVGRLGIATAGASNTKVQGTAYLNEVGAVTDFSYNINHARVGIKGLLATNAYLYPVQPYISGSFGMGFNHTFSFRSSPGVMLESSVLTSVGIPGVLYDYESNTTHSFAYTLGTGIIKRLNQNWEIGLGYEMADWGRNRLGVVLPLPFNYAAPYLSHVYTHELQLSVSFLC